MGTSDTWRDRIAFVLIAPTEPGNIGAAARALKNMGFGRLKLVRPADHLGPEARSMACGAKGLLLKAPVYQTLDEALAGKSLVVGTTRRLGSRRGLILDVREGTKRIRQAAVKNEIAILFGNEHTGLTNRDIESCGFLLTIPSAAALPSLNLAQSVMLVAYELGRPAPGRLSAPRGWPRLAAKKDLRVLEKKIDHLLDILEYGPEGDRDLRRDIRRNLGRLFGRAGLTPWELRMLLGLCRRVEDRLKEP